MEARSLRTYPRFEKMTKKTQIAEMQAILQSKGIELPDKTVSAVYGAFVDSIGAALSDGLSVTVPGLGRFETRYRGPKSFTPPHLDYQIDVPERYVPFFVAGKKLKHRVWERPVISENQQQRRDRRFTEREPADIYDSEEYDSEEYDFFRYL